MRIFSDKMSDCQTPEELEELREETKNKFFNFLVVRFPLSFCVVWVKKIEQI